MTTTVTVHGQFADTDEDAGLVNVYFDAEVEHDDDTPSHEIEMRAVAMMIAELTPIHPDDIHRLAKFNIVDLSVVN